MASRRKNGIRSAGMKTSMISRQSTAAKALNIRSTTNLKPSSPREVGVKRIWGDRWSLIQRHRGLVGEPTQLGQENNTVRSPRGRGRDREIALNRRGCTMKSGSLATCPYSSFRLCTRICHHVPRLISAWKVYDTERTRTDIAYSVQTCAR